MDRYMRSERDREGVPTQNPLLAPLSEDVTVRPHHRVLLPSLPSFPRSGVQSPEVQEPPWLGADGGVESRAWEPVGSSRHSVAAGRAACSPHRQPALCSPVPSPHPTLPFLQGCLSGTIWVALLGMQEQEPRPVSFPGPEVAPRVMEPDS